VKVYSYIVTHNSGFSPNPFHGCCTLACCKPMIRKHANIGDLIIGLTTLGRRFVYAMKVSDVLDFEDYWDTPSYASKRPDKNSSLAIDRRGDNIYQPTENGAFRQLASSHSRSDGTEDPDLKRTDLGGEMVLLSNSYAYFGADGPPVPDDLRFLVAGRGHRCRFTTEQVARVVEWFDALPKGVHGRPAMWPEDDDSWRQE